MKIGQACIGALVAMGLPSCSPPGEVIAVISTDMALQKDIDRIRIVVKYEGGQTLFDNTYDRVGDPNSATPIELPGTLGILANDENLPIRAKVMGFRGTMTDDPTIPAIRVVRDAVFTVPQDRIVTLPMPIEFLCDRLAKVKTDPMTGEPIRDENGDPVYESACDAPHTTCIAGKCEPEGVDDSDFEPYVADLYPTANTGDGTCFDTEVCFADVSTFNVDKSTCRADVPDGLSSGGTFNVALETEGSGACNTKGCFVPLDAPSDEGWNVVDGLIALPSAICDKLVNGEVARVVGASVGTAPCAQKRASIPICRAKPSDPNQPTLVVGGQTNPNAMAVDDTGIYWTMQGEFDMMGMPVPGAINGAVKMVPKTGGTPSVVVKTKGVPQGLVVDLHGFVLWTDATGDANGSIGWAKGGVPIAPLTNTLIEGLIQPGGVTAAFAQPAGGQGCDQFLAWTEFGGDRVTKLRACPEYVMLGGGTILDSVPAGVAPFAIVGASLGFSPLFCFGYQGTPGNADGVVACNENMATTTVAQNLRAPRSLVVQEDKNGTVVALYFVESDGNGAIWRAGYSAGSFSAAEKLVMDVSYPSGLTIDTSSGRPILYYTSLNERAVYAFDVDNGTTTTLATDRKDPGAVAVDDEYVYWIEVGIGNDGGIFKMKKPTMQ